MTDRSFWVAALSVAYVAFAALRSVEGRGPLAALPLALPLVLLGIWRVTAPDPRAHDGWAPPGEERVDPGERSAARATATGAAILLAARFGKEGPAFVAMGNLGAALASTAAMVGLARIGSLGGIVPPPPSARRLDAAAF